MQEYRVRVVRLLDQAKLLGKIKAQIDSTATTTMFFGLAQGLVMQVMAPDDFATTRAPSSASFDLYLQGLGAVG